jgi:5-methylcytosine-specific restriction enzyme A
VWISSRARALYRCPRSSTPEAAWPLDAAEDVGAPLNDVERAAIANLDIEPVSTPNAWIGIEDEFALAERSEIDPQVRKSIEADLPTPAIEGITTERWGRVRTRAAWKAHEFLKGRMRNSTLRCDHCGFDPSSRVDASVIRPRYLLDVHHKRPLEEGIRYTNIGDFDLLCPTCHRIAHAVLSAARRGLILRNPTRIAAE